MRRALPAVVTLVLIVSTITTATAIGAARPVADGERVATDPTASVTSTADESAASDATTNETGETTDTADGNETDENGTSVAPGARLAGVFGVQEAELEGELESRAFDVSVERARTDEARAAAINRQVRRDRARLETLRERRDRLRRAYENGSIDEDRYRALTARLTAETATLRRLTEQTERESDRVPVAVLERNGVDAAVIRDLRARAANLTGQESAAIARLIAGDRVGRGLTTDERRNASERGGDRSERDPDDPRPDDQHPDRSDDRRRGSGGGNDVEGGNDTAERSERGDHSRSGNVSDDTDGHSSEGDGRTETATPTPSPTRETEERDRTRDGGKGSDGDGPERGNGRR